MAAAAQARRTAAAPRRQVQPERAPARPAVRRAPQSRRRPARRPRHTRVFIVFVVCLTVLAVGRVSLSFAVVQKTLQTTAVVREERALSAQNAQLGEKLARMSSPVRIRDYAEKQLGLVDVDYDHVRHLRVPKDALAVRVAERP